MIDAIALAKAAKDEDALNQEQEKKKPLIFKVNIHRKRNNYCKCYLNFHSIKDIKRNMEFHNL